MATLIQLASIVQNGINGGYGVINERVPLEQIKDEIIFTSRRLYDEYKRQGFFTPEEINQFYQRIDCIELECLPLSQCCDGIKSERKVLRAKIPSVQELRYVGTVEYGLSWVISYGIHIDAIGVGRFKRNKTIAWLRSNNEIIVLNPPTYDLKYISIDAMFSDPRSLYQYSCSVCASDEDTFPIPDKFADIITGKLIASYLNYGQIKPLQPNTQDDVI
jgi:hypothetical protein